MAFYDTLAVETTEAQADIFTSLGIDWRLLILQIVAFIILVVLLGKFVYPWLMKQVDERQANIEAAAKAATQAQKATEHNKEAIAKLLSDARKEAADIVSTAKLESAELLANAEQKAQKTGEHITNQAREQLQKDVEAARKALYNDTIALVAAATEKVVGGTLSASIDEQRIATALKEGR